MKKIFRDNRGSISTVITVTVLFFLTILSTAYMVTSANRKAQIKSELIAKKTYEEPLEKFDDNKGEITGIKIGDYVNYTYDTADNYVLTSATCGSSSNPTNGIPQTTGLKWRVLNIDEANKTIDLISENPTDTTVYFSGILGYNNGPYLMNAICKAQYSNKTLGVEARSVNLLDMEKQLTTAGIAARNAYTNNVKYGTTKTYTSNTKYPSLYAGQKGAGPNVAEANASTIAQPDITKGNDPYEESKAIATTEPTTDKTAGTGNPLTVTQTFYNIPINSTNYGNAYKVLSNSICYWVASRGVYTSSSDRALFGLRDARTYIGEASVFDSSGNMIYYDYCLRPVATIKFSHLTGTKDSDGAWNVIDSTPTVTNELKIGDYVNYTYDKANNYVLSSATCGSSSNPTNGIPQTTGLKWRVLNIDEANKTIDLISENPTDTNVYFQGILGYNNGPYLMNEICKAQYSNKTLGVEARNINLLDMEKQLTTVGIATRNAYASYNMKYGTTKTYTSHTKYPSLYAGQKGAGPNVAEANASTIAQPDITKGNDPYEESKAIATTEPTTDNTSGTGNPLTVTQTYYNISINSTNYGDAYKVLSNSTSYWVASRYVNTDSGYAYFGLRVATTYFSGYCMFLSYGSTYTYNFPLRPVATIKLSHLTGTKDSDGAWNVIGSTTPTVTNELKIGDYVNYTYDTVTSGYTTASTVNGYGNQTIAQNTSTLKWRILNIDEANKTVDLISENPTSNKVGFSGVLGYNNGPYVMDKICETLYSNNSLGIKARSIDLLDIEKHLTTAGIVARNAYTGNVKYGATKTYTRNTKYPSLYAGQKGAGVNVTEANASTIVQPDISKGNDPYEESKPIATTEPTTNSTEGTGNPLTITNTYYGTSFSNDYYGDAAKVLTSSNYYWVASRCVNADTDYANFGLRNASTLMGGYYLDASDGYTDRNSYYIRPVVSIPESLFSGTKDSSEAWKLK